MLAGADRMGLSSPKNKYVLTTTERTAELFRHYCHADMHLDENILSKDEYRQAQGPQAVFPRRRGGALEVAFGTASP